MKILAIESATVTASCAVAENDKILGVYSLSHRQTHSEKLMPLIESLLKDTGTELKELELIAVSKGPGSYTGLRIGAAIGKSMAYALSIPMAGVPTMMALAANVYDTSSLIVPVLDARGGRVYSGVYRWTDGELITVKEQFPADAKELAAMLDSCNEPVILNGDGSKIYIDVIKAGTSADLSLAPAMFDVLNAGTSAVLGYHMWQKGCTLSASAFAPDYLRLSQAERNKKR